MNLRPRPLPPTAAGLLAFAVVLAAPLAEALLVAPEFHAGVIPAALLLAAGAGLHRRAPMAGMLLALLGLCTLALLPVEAVEEIGTPVFAVMFSVYVMALRTDPPRLWAGVGIALVTALVVANSPYFEPSADALFFAVALLVAAPVAAGQLLRSRLALADALRTRAARAERDRARRAEQAAAEERERIAGELHDVIAHALGAMTLQAAAARRLTERDPQQAAGAFHAIEGTGREALAELRRLLGVLRREDAELALAPQPTLGNLGDLARRAGAAGLPVTVEFDGRPPRTVPAGVEVTAFRLVQEALREAHRTGCAGRARVLVRYGDDDVVVEVADDGCGADERFLLGMRERVRVHGGDIEAGEVDGSHVLRARIPLEAPA